MPQAVESSQMNPRVAGQPSFGKGNQLGAFGNGFFDEFDGFGDISVEVEECGCGLNGGGAKFGVSDCHDEILVWLKGDAACEKK